MVHVTGMLGFAHAYFVLGLRHADGWIGYGTHIHAARYGRLATIGPPLLLDAARRGCAGSGTACTSGTHSASSRKARSSTRATRAPCGAV